MCSIVRNLLTSKFSFVQLSGVGALAVELTPVTCTYSVVSPHRLFFANEAGMATSTSAAA